MCRLTKEILQTVGKERNSHVDPWLPRKQQENSLPELKISTAALAVLSHAADAAEAHVVQRLLQGNVLATFCGKKTLIEKDLQTLQTMEEVAAGFCDKNAAHALLRFCFLEKQICVCTPPKNAYSYVGHASLTCRANCLNMRLLRSTHKSIYHP